MLVPSKYTRLEESTIFKMKCLLEGKSEDESILDVYLRTKGEFTDAAEFLHAMDVLYVLDIINLEDGSELIEYA